MANWFFYDENGYKIGPFDDATLKNLALDGTLTPDSIIETESGKKAKAQSIKGLTFVSFDLNSDYFVPPPLPTNPGSFQASSPNVAPLPESSFDQTLGASNPIVIDPKNWNGGAWLIIFSAALAILSFILPWQDIGLISANGFRLGMFSLGILFMYPVWACATNRLMNRIVAWLCAALGIIIGIAYIPLQCRVKLFDEETMIAGTGVYTFIVSSVVLAVGIFLYRRTDSVSNGYAAASATNTNILQNPKITACLGFATGLLVMFGILSFNFQREAPLEKPRIPFADDFKEKKKAEPSKKLSAEELVEFYEEKKSKLEKMKQFKILGAKFYFEKRSFMTEPVIDLSVKNNSPIAISSVSLHGKLSSPDRTLPWVEDDFSYSIPGGLEPGESAQWKLKPSIMDDWNKAPQDRKDMVFNVAVKSVTFADGTEIESSVFTIEDAEKLSDARNGIR